MDRTRTKATMTAPLARRAGALAKPAILAMALAMPLTAAAQGFAAFVSPPRFEVQAKAGEARRHVMEIHHVGSSTGRFRLYTNDVSFQEDFSVQFSDALRPGSCRPWVALERRELSIAPDAKYRFRFEVTPPPGTPAGECVFAIMLEGLDTTKVEQGQINFPVAGRIGVIVYVQTGGAAPKLTVAGSRLLVSKGERQPVIDVANAGDATGRLEGFLVARDASGREFEMSPENVPIFPGRTRAIPLFAVAQEGQKPPVIQYPLVVKGTLEWGKNRETVDLRFEP